MKIYRLHCYASGWWKMSVKMYLSLNHTRDSFKDADSSSNETHLEWVIHKLHVILFRCLIFFSSKSWENHNFHLRKNKTIQFIQNHAALFCTQTALKESSFDVACWFFFIVFSSNKWFAKKRHRINVWYHYLITLESKLGIEKNRNWSN